MWQCVTYITCIFLLLVSNSRQETECKTSCHTTNPELLNVHLIAHTHDDVGWLKTVDQYYYGSNNGKDSAAVQYILDSVTEQLWNHPNRRFVWAETYYLWRWWLEQENEKRRQVRELINTGRLEIAGGGFTENDEATTNYVSIIDQMTLGFKRLRLMFGKCGNPNVGWQLDSFGHSKEMAAIFKQMGFKGLFFARLDYQEKNERLKEKTMEMNWITNYKNDTDVSSGLFTTVLYNHYSSPPGFCFDIRCNMEPLIDDKSCEDYNIDEKVESFINFVETQAKSYRTNNVIVLMGDDFTYQDAHVNFKNLDKLVKYVNLRQSNGSKVNVMYSTPSCYLEAVLKYASDNQIQWPLKYDDFFPYASDPQTYWTGFYTSRPTLKYFEAQGSQFLQICKQLQVLARLGPTGIRRQALLEEAMGIMQHHDAVTGTEQQHVAQDYANRLYKAMLSCQLNVDNALRRLDITDSICAPESVIQSCLQLNISQCHVSEESGEFTVTVYNPLSHTVSHYVRLPVLGSSYSVIDPLGSKVTVQIIPIPMNAMNLPGRQSRASVELVFEAHEIPPLGFKSYYIRKESSDFSQPLAYVTSDNGGLSIGNKNLKVLFDERTGLLSNVIVKGIRVPIHQNFHQYTNSDFGLPSGAYVFRSNSNQDLPIFRKVYSASVFKGDIVEEVHQQFSKWLSQIIRVYRNAEHVEMEWLVGPLPENGQKGMEVISRFNSELRNDGIFYTDSNGRQMMKRQINYRPSWNVTIDDPVSGNYYPVTSRIYIEDASQGQQVSVLTDRSQGGTSLRDGQVELMLHRRLFFDDGFGVGESLNEMAFDVPLVAKGRHYLIVGQIEHSNHIASELIKTRQMSPWIFLSKIKCSYEAWLKTCKKMFSGLKLRLPDNVNILTLEQWSEYIILLRLENTENEEINSSPVHINLKELFSHFTITSASETLLGGINILSEQNNNQKQQANKHFDNIDNFLFSLKPKQIRTFLIKINYTRI